MLGQAPSPYGGWLINASNNMSNQDGIELSVAFPQKKQRV